MKKMTKVLAMATLALSLVGCGGSSSSDTIIVATDTTYRPFEMQDDAGNLIGIDMDLIRAIAEDQGLEIEIQSLGFDAACAALESGAADVVIAGMTINDARIEKYDFSAPYYETGVSMAVASESGITSYEDLAGKTVVAKTSTVGYEFASSIQEQYGFDLEVVEESVYMFDKVAAGEAVALFEDSPVLLYEIKMEGRDLIVPLGNENPADYGIAVMKGQNDELLEKIDAGLENLKANGKYQEILKTYE